MSKIDTKGLLKRVFIPTTLLTSTYLLLGHFCKIPHLLLFFILATVILVPMEFGTILFASKNKYGTYSLKSSIVEQERLPVWKILIIAFVFFGLAGLLSAFIAPIENQIFAEMRATVLKTLPTGFDWTDYEYIRNFPRPMLILTCVYYAVFNVLILPIMEELYFRGYLTFNYQKQGSFTPLLIAILFSLYHFWLPFNNVFRILVFAPVAYISYKKKNLFISISFHCLCNLFSSINFILAVLG